jgi:hypothetical protein
MQFHSSTSLKVIENPDIIAMLRRAINLFLPADGSHGSFRGVDSVMTNHGKPVECGWRPPFSQEILIRPFPD